MKFDLKRLRSYQVELITFFLVFIFLLILMSDMSFKGLRPGGVDVIGSKGKTQQLREFQEKTGETALWNPPLFSGMPYYHRIGGRVFSLDTFFNNVLGKILYLYIWLYLLGFIGMYYLLREFKISFWAAVICSLSYILIPYYMSMLSIGHFAKFRPVLYMPIVTYFFVSFLNKGKLLRLSFFILVFSIQIRTQHYQIIFYQIILLLFLGVFYLVKQVKVNKKTALLRFVGTVFSSVIIFLMVAQPLLVTRDYTPYSIRGGTGDDKSTGLSSDYATKWSLNPAEMIVWFMPRFYGGTSGEIYNGTRVDQFKGQRIPGYWGEMPFTQSYDYIGAILLILAIFGLITSWGKGLIKLLAGLFVLSLLLSFGRHFSLIYDFFFRYVPTFNKFRVPAMVSILMHFLIVIFAGFGLTKIFSRNEDPKRITKILTGVLIFTLILGLIPLLFGSEYDLIKTGETQQYNPQAVKYLQTARLEMMQNDGIRLILLSLVFYLIFMLYRTNKLKSYIFIILIIGLIMVDQIPFFKKAEGELYDSDTLEKVYFKKSDTDRFILQDQDYYRIFPLTENPFNNSDWCYYHNSIGGYSGAKLRIYQDIIENCFFSGTDDRLPLNWQLIRMLNTRYIISNQELPDDQLQKLFYDKREELFTYRLKPVPEPAWFVKEIKIIPDKQARLDSLNEQDYNVYSTAILEKDPPFMIQKPDSVNISVEEASINHITYEVYNNKPGLFVASEIFYPQGWKCFVNNQETEIYKTNHVLRSVYVENRGYNTIRFVFEPDKFRKYYTISLFGHIIAWILLLLGIISSFKKRVQPNDIDNSTSL